MKWVVVIGHRFESYITIVIRKNLSVYPVIYKSSKMQFLLEPAGGVGGLE